MKNIINKPIAQNVSLHVIPCSIFKTIKLSVKFQNQLNDDYTLRALLPFVLKRGCKKYTTHTQIQKHLQSLYGALFNTNVTKAGDKQIISFNMDFVNEKFIPGDENIFESSADFLHEIIFNPLLENQLFNKDYVNQEANNLTQQISAVINDKQRYSVIRLLEEINPGKPCSKYAYGSAEELNNVEGTRLMEVYRDFISKSKVDIFVVGEVDVLQAEQIVKKSFAFASRGGLPAYSPALSSRLGMRNINETMAVNQAMLGIGLRTGTIANSADFYSLLMMNSVFGGTVNSKLFMNVREKASLCYYIASAVDKFNAILYISTGIDPQKSDEAYKITMKQLDDIKNGGISDAELRFAVKDFEMNNKAMGDSAALMIEFYYAYNTILELNITPDDFMENIRAVKKEDIIRVSNKLTLDTVYLLKN